MATNYRNRILNLVAFLEKVTGIEYEWESMEGTLSGRLYCLYFKDTGNPVFGRDQYFYAGEFEHRLRGLIRGAELSQGKR